MEINNERLAQLVTNLLISIDNNCYEFSEKLNVIKDSGITADELKLLGFEYMNCWFEDLDNADEYEEPEWEEPDWDEEYIPSAENGDYSPSTPWNAPGCSIDMFININD